MITLILFIFILTFDYILFLFDYIKIMRFAGYGFLPYLDPFLECQRFLQFIKASSLILSCFSGSFPLFIYYTLLVGVVEGKKRIVDESGGGIGKIGQSSFI